MPELPTVEIRSWKDPEVKWIINQADLDPDKHTLWGEEPRGGMEAQAAKEEEADEVAEPDATEPEADDIVHDRRGEAIALYVVNPDDRRARMRIAVTDYDPDVHTLWSQRFK